jgi:hypothetical protein
LIKNGTLLFVYGKDPEYLETSKFWMNRKFLYSNT